MTADDVLEFMVAGATAVQIGTANFVDPKTCEKALCDLEARLEKENVARIEDLIGTLQT